jgi:upstream activation factor subunit UAF30
MPRTKKPEQQPEMQSSPLKTQSKKMTPEKQKKQEDVKPSPVKDVSKMSNEVVEPQTSVDTPAASVDATLETSLSDEFTSILGQVQSLTQHLTGLKTALRTLEKKTARELKQANKAKKKSKNAKANRQPSGFVKPTLISDELASFLDKPKGTELARTDVTKEINVYIREHKLQDPTNGRRILADDKLKALLHLKSEDELTYFNLQKFMSPHFAKATPKPVAV